MWGRAPLEDDARIVVVNAKRLRAVQRRMRETHRKMFDLQGNAIVALREALNAVSATHDEMLALFQEINDLDTGGQGPPD